MISRTWHGAVPLEHESGFAEYLERTGVKEALELDGNLGAYVEKLRQGNYSHFFLCTVWKSWREVVLYAGENPTVALTYPEDERYGLISDPIVIHQMVIDCGNPFTIQPEFC